MEAQEDLMQEDLTEVQQISQRKSSRADPIKPEAQTYSGSLRGVLVRWILAERLL